MDDLGPEPVTESRKPVLKGDLKGEHLKIGIAILSVVGAAVAAVYGFIRSDTREIVHQVTDVQAQKHDALLDETRRTNKYFDARLDRTDKNFDLVLDKMRVPESVRPPQPVKPPDLEKR